MRGLLVVNKAKGWTSFDIVNYCKHTLKTREVGHLGTLDPMATGVLVVTVGSATKLFDMFLNKTKKYVAKFEFGYSTDTLDAEGCLENKTDNIPSLQQISQVLPLFLGQIEQIPPKYSAKKINGQKAYDLARKGKDFELKPSKIMINNLKILDYSNNVLTIEIECGAGTYIRSLGRDIALKLNSLATMIELTRIEVGNFTLENSINIKDENVDIEKYILPIDSVFYNLPTLDSVEDVARLINGQTLIRTVKDGDYKMYLNGEFVGIATSKDQHLKMSKFFKI